MKKFILLVALFILGLNACTNNAKQVQATETVVIEPTIVIVEETSTPPAYLPLPSDGNLTKASAFIDSADLLFVETDPVQIELILSGHLPTPCHELRVYIPPPDEENNIKVEIYSVADPEVICEQVLRAFNTTVYMGSYPDGSYWVWVNEEKIGNFDF